jgi:hypothetical protein
MSATAKERQQPASRSVGSGLPIPNTRASIPAPRVSGGYLPKQSWRSLSITTLWSRPVMTGLVPFHERLPGLPG